MKTKTHMFSYEEFLNTYFPMHGSTNKTSSPFETGVLISQNALDNIRKSITPSLPHFSKKQTIKK